MEAREGVASTLLMSGEFPNNNNRSALRRGRTRSTLRWLLWLLVLSPLALVHAAGNTPLATTATAVNALAPPTVTGFWPGNGPAGTIVFVFGSDFDANPGGTKVQVNGLSAPLAQTVSNDLLLFMLPAGNTSGSICVTTSQGTTCSASVFGTSLSGVNISAFWSTQGKAGNVIFVFGSGLDPAPGKTQVSLGSTPCHLVQVLDPALLLFVVPPPPATSGPITVTTPQGSATSTTSFTVLTAAASVTRNYTLYISPGTWTINGNGGTTLDAWSFTDQAGLTKVPGPVLTGLEGDTFNITVVNNHNINHNFKIQGLTTDTTAIAPGASKTYTFTTSTSSAGTYLYFDTLNSNINREMGMYGMLWLGPADGSAKAWTGGPSYTFQRMWVTSDMDKPRWNDVAGTGGTVNTAVYKPNYFMINGLGGFDSMAALGKNTIDGSVGQTALVRIVNPGQFPYSLHFHANHLELLTVNGVRQSSPYKKLDVVNIPPLGTADILFYLNQPGKYPMHVHTAQMETANGVYLNGAVTMIDIK